MSNIILFPARPMTHAESLLDYQKDMNDDDDLYFGKSTYFTKVSAEAYRKRRAEVEKYAEYIKAQKAQEEINTLAKWDALALILCLLLAGIGIFNIVRYFWG